MLLVVFAHPYPDRSVANRVLLQAVRGAPGVEIRSLYDLYPDFAIDVDAEQEALSRAGAVVWQHPMYWYSVPGLLKHWFDKVLLRGWAYGPEGRALVGKRCLWVTTTGGDESAFNGDGMHGHSFESFLPPVKQTAEFCGMQWEEPMVVLGAQKLESDALGAAARRYRERVDRLLAAIESGA